MFRILFDIIINMLATLVQIVVYPINVLVSSFLPDISENILIVTNTFNTVFDSISWGLGLLPQTLISILLFVILCEIAKHSIYISTHALIKIWSLFQKLKFW